jgi:hypothetical protein
VSAVDEPLWVSSMLDEPLWLPSMLDEPLWVLSMLDEPLWVPSMLDEPLWIPSMLDVPLWVPSMLDEPLWVPSILDEPLWVPSMLDEPLWVPKMLANLLEPAARLRLLPKFLDNRRDRNKAPDSNNSTLTSSVIFNEFTLAITHRRTSVDVYVYAAQGLWTCNTSGCGMRTRTLAILSVYCRHETSQYRRPSYSSQ